MFNFMQLITLICNEDYHNHIKFVNQKKPIRAKNNKSGACLLALVLITLGRYRHRERILTNNDSQWLS